MRRPALFELIPPPHRPIEEILADWEKDCREADRRLNLADVPSVIPAGGGGLPHKVSLGHLDRAGQKKQVRKWRLK